jgi:type I restriction enzyme S subunit
VPLSVGEVGVVRSDFHRLNGATANEIRKNSQSNQTIYAFFFFRRVLSAKNVRDGFIDYRDHDLISESDFQKCRVRCDAKPNDILIVCVGATIGRTSIVREETEFALVRSVALLRPEKVNPKFLLYAIQSDIGQKQIANVKRGSAQACLYLHRIRKISIPLPPLAEQTRIVAEVERRLSVVEELAAVVSANLQRATRLRQSILQKAFTGELA